MEHLPSNEARIASGHISRPDLRGNFGMCASTHWLATATAQSVLERGGNAFDAVVAGGFVLHVVEPHLNGPGGDMVALISVAGNIPVVINGQGPAPQGATVAHYQDEGLDHVPGAGGLATAIPAAVEAWLTILQNYGTWSLTEILQYAINYAESGHIAGTQLCGVIETMSKHFDTHWPTSAELWMPEGRAPRPGETIRNPTYARTLKRLLATAQSDDRAIEIDLFRRAWKSDLAKHAVSFLGEPHRHSSGTDHAAVISEDDFQGLQISTEEPLTLNFHGTSIVKAGFWSQGPVLLQALSILNEFDPEHLDPSTAQGVHTIIEAVKLAMADRDAYYGETAGDLDELNELISPEYAKRRAALITSEACHEFRPGHLGGRTPFHPHLKLTSSVAVDESLGEPTVKTTGDTRGDTCHLDVVDRFGNMVSATPSGGWLQSSPVIPELGFCLGSRLQMTWFDESSPSRLEPGMRPRTTLSPTMLVRNGQTVAALGTPGGDQQDQWQLLYLLRVLVMGLSPQEAIDAPMFHTTAVASSFWPRTWTPGGVVTESDLGAEVLADLRRRGHQVTDAGNWSLGRLSTVQRDPRSGLLSAAANSRGGQGYAAGR